MIEPVLICNRSVGNMKLSEGMKFLNIIAQHWGLELKCPRHYKIALRILNNSINKN